MIRKAAGCLRYMSLQRLSTASSWIKFNMEKPTCRRGKPYPTGVLCCQSNPSQNQNPGNQPELCIWHWHHNTPEGSGFPRRHVSFSILNFIHEEPAHSICNDIYRRHPAAFLITLDYEIIKCTTDFLFHCFQGAVSCIF